MKNTYWTYLAYAVITCAVVSMGAQAATKDYLAIEEDVSTKRAPIDTHAEFEPLRPADKLHSESPILRDNLALQDAPTSIKEDTRAFLTGEPEDQLALKPKKTKRR